MKTYRTPRRRLPRFDITNRRTELGMSIAEVGRRTGIDHGLLSRIEAGKRRVSLNLAPLLSQVLGMEVVALLYPPGPESEEIRNELRAAMKAAEDEVEYLKEQLRLATIAARNSKPKKPKDPERAEVA